MKYWILSLMLLTSLKTSPPDEAIEKDRNNKIQIALLLDTSNSMDGLIEQAKGKLWSIVNEFGGYRKGEAPPSLEIALFEYGNDGLREHEDWIRQITAFTTDLDFISEKLFELTTYGGSEYCGSVIRDANRKLEWSNRQDDLKLIFIAGNEAFNQGRYNYRDACNESTGKGIAVNTIYCGDYEQGIRELWKEGALSGEGRYINIDQNRDVTYVETPYDKDLDQLNEELNDTYIYYGSEGQQRKANQSRQDDNAASFSGANAAERTVSKASEYYVNPSWDLVDAYKEAGGKLESLGFDPGTLPAELRGKTGKEIEAFIVEMQKKRESIQAGITQVNRKRQEYISGMQTGEENTLEHAIKRIVEELAREKGFRMAQEQ